MSEAGIEYEFEGNPDCGPCGALAGTLGSREIPRPHENCGCESKVTCKNEYSFETSVTRYGPLGLCFILNVELEVTCWDGTKIGQSIPLDYGCEGADQDILAFWEGVWTDLADDARELEEGCPDCGPPLVA